MEIGDTFEETAVRNLFEETGLVVSKLKFLDVVSGRDLCFKYPHGDEVYSATVIYKAINATGKLKRRRKSRISLLFVEFVTNIEPYSL